MVKKLKKKAVPRGPGSVPRLKSAVDGAALSDAAGEGLEMDVEGRGNKARTKNSKVKRSLVRKKRRVKVLGARHKDRRKGINQKK